MTTIELFYTLLIQVGTLLASLLFFGRLSLPVEEIGKESKTGNKWEFKLSPSLLPVFFGVLLYMTCPYRIRLFQDPANLRQAAAMALLPLYLWAMTKVRFQGRRLVGMVVAALALAGMGYADVVFFLTAAGLTLLVSLLSRKPRLLLPVAAGSMLFLPGLYRLARYLFSDAPSSYEVALRSIMPDGYRLGELFHSYFFRDNRPGLGIGILICLAAGLWMRFIDRDTTRSGICAFFSLLSVFLLLLSLRLFPWDLVQRLGAWALKLVSLIGTPTVFAGMAYLCLCVPAAFSIEQIGRHRNRTLAFAVPALAALSCVLVCLLSYRPFS